MLQTLSCSVRSIRYPHELDDITGLVIPGGESTTMSKQLDVAGLREGIVEFAQGHPILGTCAGLILMAKDHSDTRVDSLGLLDIAVTRNSWGRQIHSFTTPIEMHRNGHQEAFPAVFIRAPRITRVGQEVEILAEYQDEPVFVRHGRHIGVTFHPELTSDTRIHDLFIKTVQA